MRVVVEVDGRSSEVEVADGTTEVRVGGHRFPVKVVSVTATRVELEIGGEKVLLEGWVQGQESPVEPVTLNGESHRVALTVAESARPARAPPKPAATSSPTIASSPDGPSSTRGTSIVPPMPGKVVELRVKDGERVRAGQVLLVLEAMKMRNEVAAPIAGTVEGLSVAAGANVRAREPMLRIVP